jgi:DNA repair protein RadC
VEVAVRPARSRATSLGPSAAEPSTAPTTPPTEGEPDRQAPGAGGDLPAADGHWRAVPAPPGWRLEPGDPSRRAPITTPEESAAVLAPLVAGGDREMCVMAALDTKHRLLVVDTVSVGTADHTFMAPREIYRDALLAGASAIVVAHNHPSADATPSADDRQITRRLAQAGATLGVELLDHLVVGDPHWTSLARLGVV